MTIQLRQEAVFYIEELTVPACCRQTDNIPDLQERPAGIAVSHNDCGNYADRGNAGRLPLLRFRQSACSEDDAENQVRQSFAHQLSRRLLPCKRCLT